MKAAAQGLSDVALFCLAAVLSLVLRENFAVAPERWAAFLPYCAALALASIVVFPLMGLPRTIWRLTTMSDFMRVLTATTVATIAGVVLAFAFNRLDGVARSLPVLQLVLGGAMLVGVRVIARLNYQARLSRRQPQAPLKVA